MLRKKNNNKKIVIYKALMLPLMTMFLLNIGLVATTWAWYTASVSSGVNSIKAGVDVSVQVFEKGTDNPVEVQNNSISLEAGKEYSFTFTSGSAANGYYALITVSNPTVATNPITNLFMTTAYAESDELYAVEIPAENTTKEITIHAAEDKQIRFDYLWKSDEIKHLGDEKIAYKEVEYSLISNTESLLTIGKVEVVYTVTYMEGEKEIGKSDYRADNDTVKVIAPDGFYLQPEENETDPVPQRSYPISKFRNNELTVTVVPNEEGTNNNSTDDPAEEDAVLVEAAPESVTGNAGEQSIPSRTESEAEPTTPGQEQITTPDEPTLPVQEPEQSTAPSEFETNSTQPNGETVVEEDKDEPAGEEETAIEENMEVVDNAQSESGD